MSTILVTGGLGFIGSNFIRYILANTGHKIINYDKITYAGNPNNLKDIEKNPNYTFVKGDICDLNAVEKAVSKADMIVHFAAETHVDRSIEDPLIFTKTNVLGTHCLLEASRRHNISRFVHISTDEVYGSIKKGSFKETDNLDPSSPYSASKAGSDLLALSYHKTFNLPVIVTRTTNNFGPYQYPEKLIPRFITNLMDGHKVPVYGTGKNVRDWIHVMDNCDAINFVLENGKVGEIYNIAGKNEKNNLYITEKILEHSGKDESYIEHVEDRLGHDFRYSLNANKLKKLGWAPKHKFDEMLKETVKWYQENEWWWRPLKSKMQK